MQSDIEIYANHMADVRTRIYLVRSLLAPEAAAVIPQFALIETVLLQLRKALELIAFASLTANKDAYKDAYPTFADEWNAKRILQKVEQLNPDFYPMACEAPKEVAPGHKHFDRPADGFMTRDEFITLYQAASEVLHTRNPFTTKGPVINTGYSVVEWVSRIQRLLSWHRVGLIGGSIWIVKVPDVGDVEAWPAGEKTDVL